MKIYFGQYSIKIKTFRPADVRYKKGDLDHLRLELRMRVYHLMFIPFAPRAKFWKVINETTNQVTEQIDPDLKHLMNLEELRRKTPFYAYSGLFLSGLIFLSIFLFPLVAKLRHDQFLSDMDKDQIEATRMEIDSLKSGDILEMRATVLKKKPGFNGKKYAKDFDLYFSFEVVSANDQLVALKFAPGQRSYKKEEFDQYFAESAQEGGQYVVPKHKLLRAASLNLLSNFIADRPSKMGVEIREIRDLTLFRVESFNPEK